MNEAITLDDVKMKFFDWQGWWYVAKITGEIEDLRASTNAFLEYENAFEVYSKTHSVLDIDEQALYAEFIKSFEEHIEEDVLEEEKEAGM